MQGDLGNVTAVAFERAQAFTREHDLALKAVVQLLKASYLSTSPGHYIHTTKVYLFGYCLRSRKRGKRRTTRSRGGKRGVLRSLHTFWVYV
jgi:hypothetical protein